MSNSQICHDSSSPFYSRTKNYTAYSSIDECVKNGGKAYGGAANNKPSDFRAYSRDMFGIGWQDFDGDCKNTRHEILASQSTSPVRYKSASRCRVAAGKWISFYTGKTYYNPATLDIDHVVPLYWAWRRGAAYWPDSKRVSFANDASNLLAVESSLNRDKSADGPDLWLPPANKCQYLVRFKKVVTFYGLKPSSKESASYRQLIAKHCQ